MQQTISSSLAAVFGGAVAACARKKETPIADPFAGCTDRDPGYVYLSVSSAMPGFVQIDTSKEDPTGLTWSLRTYTGVTRFKNVHAVRTSDCGALAERFRQAVPFDQIPHHDDFFKIRLRLARNIIETEAESLPPTWAAPAPRRDPRKIYGIAAAVVAVIVIPLSALAFHGRSAAVPAVRPAAQAAPAPRVIQAPAKVQPEPAAPPRIPMPKFRFSGV